MQNADIWQDARGGGGCTYAGTLHKSMPPRLCFFIEVNRAHLGRHGHALHAGMALGVLQPHGRLHEHHLVPLAAAK